MFYSRLTVTYVIVLLLYSPFLYKGISVSSDL